MNKKLLSGLWAGLFIVCAGLGFIPEPESALQILMTLLSLFFFLPPAMLLYEAGRHQDRATILVIRNLAVLSLVSTMILLIFNFLTVLSSETLGQILYYMLVIISSPMICSGHWALSLFLWACLLFSAHQKL